MSTLELPPTSLPAAHAVRNRWCFLLLDHLTEFATLAWYLVADGNLVEEAFLRGISQLEQIPFEDSRPAAAHDRARDIIISQAIAVLEDARQPEGPDRIAIPIFPANLPDLCHLASILRIVVRKPGED